MKLFKFFAKLAIAFLALGIIASLVLNNSKEEYIAFDDTDSLDLY